MLLGWFCSFVVLVVLLSLCILCVSSLLWVVCLSVAVVDCAFCLLDVVVFVLFLL